jgi:hypothetical protein
MFTEETQVARMIPERMSAHIEGDFVVFLIGMRFNKPWKVHKWWPVFIAMPKMLKELETAGPESGFLGHNGLGVGPIIQYWRSFDHLEAYARDTQRRHWPAWVDFNKAAKGARGDVGIWHETFLVKAGQYEAIYSGMPPYGLGRVSSLVPASGSREAARERLSAGSRERQPSVPA